VDHDAYRTGIGELYAAEVLGEGLASRWLLSYYRCFHTRWFVAAEAACHRPFIEIECYPRPRRSREPMPGVLG